MICRKRYLIAHFSSVFWWSASQLEDKRRSTVKNSSISGSLASIQCLKVPQCQYYNMDLAVNKSSFFFFSPASNLNFWWRHYLIKYRFYSPLVLIFLVVFWFRRKTNTKIIKEALIAGFFLSQALIVSVRQQRTLGAQPHGEMSCRTGGDGVMTKWVGLSVRTHSRRTWKIQ